eukprot:scaffold85145_cov80-Phaeocystis_antarctica.AAC.3
MRGGASAPSYRPQARHARRRMRGGASAPSCGGATPPLRARHTCSRPAPHYATPARPDPVVSLRGRFPEATPSKPRAARAASPQRSEAQAQPQWSALLYANASSSGQA